MNPELEKLIKAALADNKLTAKEMEVLVNKAKKLGIDEDEFRIELDALLHQKRKEQRSNQVNFTARFLQRLGWKKGLGILGALFIIIILFIPWGSGVEKKYNNALEARDFDKAYDILIDIRNDYTDPKYANDHHLRLLNIYIPFLLENGFPDKAHSALEEYNYEADLEGNFNSNPENISIYNNLLMDVFSYNINNNSIENATQNLNSYAIDLQINDLAASYTERTIERENQRIMERNNAIINILKNAVNLNNISKDQAIAILKANLIIPFQQTNLDQSTGDYFCKRNNKYLSDAVNFK